MSAEGILPLVLLEILDIIRDQSGGSHITSFHHPRIFFSNSPSPLYIVQVIVELDTK